MRRTLLALAALTLMGSPALGASRRPAPSRPLVTRPACRPLDGDAPVRLRFVDAPLHEVLGFFACVTGARFVTHEDLSGRSLDLAAEGPVRLAEAWTRLLHALGRAGLEIVVDGDQVLVQRIQV